MQGIAPPSPIPSRPFSGTRTSGTYSRCCNGHRHHHRSLQGHRMERWSCRNNSEELVVCACHGKSSVSHKESIGVCGKKQHGRRQKIHQNHTGGMFKFPQLDQISTWSLEDSSFLLNMYTHLLGDGRLSDCIEFLERMEEKGVLDMDKVHHAKFLKMCKSHKAVKEALRFTSLIRRPTLSTFNMLLSVCASSQDSDGAYHVLLLVKEAGLKPDCQLYTTLISSCAKSGKVDAMFEVFHEMVNAGVEPNVYTYAALIDGCARAGQVAKAFGAYGIMSSKGQWIELLMFWQK